MCQLSSSTSPCTRAFSSSRSMEHVLGQRFIRPVIGRQRGQHMVEAVVIFGNVLVLQGEHQHFFFVELDLSGRGQPILRRLLGANEFVATARWPFSLPSARSRYGTSMMETFGSRPEIAGGSDAMGSSRYSLRSSSLERHGGAEVGERIAERNHFAAETLRKLTDTEFGKIRLRCHLVGLNRLHSSTRA